MLLALGGAAAAQSPARAALPALKASVTVTGDIVTIGDLVENAGPVADVPIFRAPDLGTTGAVATDRILDAIRPHQLIGIDTHGLAEVIVTRASRAIAAREISARIAQALSGQYGFGDARNILINFDGDVRTLQVEPNVTGELQVLALSYDPRTTRFDVTFDLPESIELHRQPARYTGTGDRDRSMPLRSIVRSSAARCSRRPISPWCGGPRPRAASSSPTATPRSGSRRGMRCVRVSRSPPPI